jgi:hypothetical protein
LDHAEKEIRDFVGSRAKVVFVPFAVHDRQAYAAKAQARFRDIGLSLTSIHDVSNMPRAVDEADVVFVGGGNTFRLLKELYDHNLLGAIRPKSSSGCALHRIERWLHRGVSDSENNQRHARSPAPIIRGIGSGSIPDQSTLLRP